MYTKIVLAVSAPTRTEKYLGIYTDAQMDLSKTVFAIRKISASPVRFMLTAMMGY